MCIKEHARMGGEREVVVPKGKPATAIGGKERPALVAAVTDGESVGEGGSLDSGALEQAGARGLAGRALSVLTGGRLGGGKEVAVPAADGSGKSPEASKGSGADDDDMKFAVSVAEAVGKIMQPEALQASNATPAEVVTNVGGQADAVMGKPAGQAGEVIVAVKKPAAERSPETVQKTLREILIKASREQSQYGGDRNKVAKRLWQKELLVQLCGLIGLHYKQSDVETNKAIVVDAVKAKLKELLGREADRIAPRFLQ